MSCVQWGWTHGMVFQDLWCIVRVLQQFLVERGHSKKSEVQLLAFHSTFLAGCLGFVYIFGDYGSKESTSAISQRKKVMSHLEENTKRKKKISKLNTSCFKMCLISRCLNGSIYTFTIISSHRHHKALNLNLQ